MFEIALTLGTVAAVVVALATVRTAPDLPLAGGLALLIVSGVVSPREAFEGFTNEGLVAVGVLYVVAEGLRQTGGVAFAGQRLLGTPGSLRSAQTRIVLPTAVMSAFMNNTPVVAMVIPVLTDWARKLELSVSRLLMPLSFAAILGGLCTLIGTRTTLVVNGLLEEATGKGLGMFDIAWVGVPATLVGLAYVLAFGSSLLPERRPPMTQFDDPREYSVEMLVDPKSPLVGKTIQEAGLRNLPGMYLVEIDRDGHVLAAVSSGERVEANDRLVFVGVVESVKDVQKIPGLVPATDQLFKLDAPRAERCLVEAVVSNTWPYVGQTIRDAKFRTRYNAAVIAVSRNGQQLRGKVGDIEMLPGDTLLLEAHPSFVELQRNSRDFYLVGLVDDSSPPRHEKAWIARLILAALVVVVALELLTMVKAALVAAAAMVLTRCCRGTEARRSIDWSVLLAMGAGLGIGKAMETSGAADVLAGGLLDVAGDNRSVALAVVYLVTMVFTNLITAKAAAVLFFPFAIATAGELGVSPMPFAIAVIVASAASFATPIGYQTNLMVYGPGGYRFSDYARFGAPLSLLVMAVSLVVIPLVWPFQ